MKKLNIGIFLSLLLMVGLCSCEEQKSNTKLVLNEVLIENESNFQDDYGVHSAWIEIFNRSFGSADLAGCLLKVSSQPGDTATYFIPKGDVLTLCMIQAKNYWIRLLFRQAHCKQTNHTHVSATQQMNGR